MNKLNELDMKGRYENALLAVVFAWAVIGFSWLAFVFFSGICRYLW